MSKSFIILGGSNRLDGNSTSISNTMLTKYGIKTVELSQYEINHYDYLGNYPKDDQFISLIEDKILYADHLIWLTPMYWYSMSGIMKQFLDRWTDLLKTHKDLGRQLKGKEMSLIYHSNGSRLAEFEIPFKLTANYLGMDYVNALHLNMSKGESMSDHENSIIDYYELIN